MNQAFTLANDGEDQKVKTIPSQNPKSRPPLRITTSATSPRYQKKQRHHRRDTPREWSGRRSKSLRLENASISEEMPTTTTNHHICDLSTIPKETETPPERHSSRVERPSEQIPKTRERKHIGRDGGDRVAAKRRWIEVKGGRLLRRHAPPTPELQQNAFL
ncbi:hypothetical protein F2Q69_00024684 [Brassica cretica]|uniref:Uncharacterized protein n=1 Tax=Brassica cretica TaxID=69181 RepID=A0A8S9QHA0_BRACR|nr:hypothetical protein F2Q69_00024684 [Brassica cretica]